MVLLSLIYQREVLFAFFVGETDVEDRIAFRDRVKPAVDVKVCIDKCPSVLVIPRPLPVEVEDGLQRLLPRYILDEATAAE